MLNKVIRVIEIIIELQLFPKHKFKNYTLTSCPIFREYYMDNQRAEKMVGIFAIEHDLKKQDVYKERDLKMKLR